MRENIFQNAGWSSPGYTIRGRGNVVATPPAGTDALGHMVAMRNPVTSLRAWLVTRLKVVYSITGEPAAAQEIGFSIFKATGYTASHTGGIPMIADPQDSGYPAVPLVAVPAAADLRIADTAALTDGTHAALTRLKGSISRLYPAAAETVLTPELVYEWIPRGGKGELLQGDEGLIVPNLILGGAGSAVRVHFEADIQVE